MEGLKLKIAQIAPLIESVPPRLYGGTERIVSYLTEELVGLGHDVTLFASGDLITSANLVPCVPKALRLDTSVRDTIPYYMLMLDRVRQAGRRLRRPALPYRSIPFPAFSADRRPHRDYAARPSGSARSASALPGLRRHAAGFDLERAAPSGAARRTSPAPSTTESLPACITAPREARGGYLAFLGRISPEKRPDRAIAIAACVGIPLKIAAKVDRADAAYFETEIEPLLDGGGVEFIGEINDRQKTQFLGDAQALLFPDRLAGAVRALHDRGDGLRHAGTGFSLRLGSGNHRGRHHRRYCRNAWMRRSRPCRT